MAPSEEMAPPEEMASPEEAPKTAPAKPPKTAPGSLRFEHQCSRAASEDSAWEASEDSACEASESNTSGPHSEADGDLVKIPWGAGEAREVSSYGNASFPTSHEPVLQRNAYWYPTTNNSMANVPAAPGGFILSLSGGYSGSAFKLSNLPGLIVRAHNLKFALYADILSSSSLASC